MINRDVTFDEMTILNPRLHEGHDNQVEAHGTSMNVELEIEVLKQESEET